jgi:group I intron endonuclease
MPYKQVLCGIYRITNLATQECYVGQSRNLKKRIADHFRLLRLNKHPNSRLQSAYNTYGLENFVGEIEIECETPEDLDMLEELFLSGEATFEAASAYNISSTAHAPMAGRKHSDEVRERIRMGRRAATYDYKSDEYRAKQSAAQINRYRSDPKALERLKFIVNNPDMSYAERGRRMGITTVSARKLALKYQHLKGTL